MKKEGRRRARVCVYVIVFAHARVVRERIIRLIYQKKKKKTKKNKKEKKNLSDQEIKQRIGYLTR